MFKKIMNWISRKWYTSKSDRATIAENLYSKASFRLAECQVLLDKKTRECDELITANGQLKREIDMEIRQKEEISSMLDEVTKKYEAEKYESFILAASHYCEKDCKRYNYRGPGGSYCRNCKRNPNAVDKYEKGETQDDD